MNEARRFLRYVTPGLVFAIEVISLLWLLRPDWIAMAAGTLTEKENAAGITALLASVVASGGIGFFFGVVHHTWHWRFTGAAMDHSDLIRRLVEAGILRLRGYDIVNLTRADAWIIASALWHERINTNGQIRSAEPRSKDLADLVHSMGTARIAAIAAPLLSFCLAAANSDLTLALWPLLRFGVAVAIALLVFIVLHCSYHRTARVAQGVIDETLSDALVAEQGNNTTPIITWPLL